MFECSADGCSNSLYAGGFCCAHYKRLKLYGRLDKAPLGTKTKHPLYVNWNARKQRSADFVDEWKNDFWKFVKDVGEQPENTYLTTIRKNELCGPNNFQWKPVFVALENETDNDRRKRQRKEFSINDPNFFRAQNYKYTFGITINQYNEMLAKQNGVCYICKNKETATYKGTNKIKNLAVDHNHLTKEIRKLLCSKCNLFIGKLEENIHLLDLMKAYLLEHSTKHS